MRLRPPLAADVNERFGPRGTKPGRIVERTVNKGRRTGSRRFVLADTGPKLGMAMEWESVR